MLRPGLRAVCIREVQKTLKSSAKKLIEDLIQLHGLGPAFDVLDAEIRAPGGGLILFQGMQDHNAESIKSLEGVDIAWCEEAQSLSARSLSLLRPTIRREGSELWFSWNRTRKNDPVDQFLTGFTNSDGLYVPPPDNAIVVRANWSDNPWFPAVLEAERASDKHARPDQYGHTWEGEYQLVAAGAYYASALTDARSQGRVGKVAADPLMQYRAFWDIGVRDATAIWVAQFIGREVRVLDYYEATGQPLGAHLTWLRMRGYSNALCVLPHDGSVMDAVSAIRFEDHIRSAGFQVQTIPNQGKGAALKRVETARRLFPQVWFNEATTSAGIDALGAYHEKRDETRNIGLGPEHDFSSHGADAFGLMCVAYEDPLRLKAFERKIVYPKQGYA